MVHLHLGAHHQESWRDQDQGSLTREVGHEPNDLIDAAQCVFGLALESRNGAACGGLRRSPGDTAHFFLGNGRGKARHIRVAGSCFLDGNFQGGGIVERLDQVALVT